MFNHPTIQPTNARCLRGTSCADAVYSPPEVGYALTISAMLAARAKHMIVPKIQHHVTCVAKSIRSSVWSEESRYALMQGHQGVAGC
jgi:hypothetical protein